MTGLARLLYNTKILRTFVLNQVVAAFTPLGERLFYFRGNE